MKKRIVLKSFLSNSEQLSQKEIHSLDEVKMSGNYIVVARGATTGCGFPQIDRSEQSCYCCEGVLEVACCYTDDESQCNSTYCQKLTICDRETGCAGTYIRVITPQKNDGSWGQWQMVATGDPELVSGNNEINEMLSALAAQIDSELVRAQAKEEEILGLAKSVIATPVVEIGSFNDNTGEAISNMARLRCAAIPRKDIAVAVLTKPSGLDLWIQLLDEDKRIIGTEGGLWSYSNKPIVVANLVAKAQFLNFVFKRTDGANITETDTPKANGYVVDVMTAFTRRKSYNLRYNNGVTPILIRDNRVYISPEGFGLLFDDGDIYYAADASKSKTEPYVFEFNKNLSAYLVVDSTKFVTKDVRTELSDVVSIKEKPVPSDIIIAYGYSKWPDYYINLVGQFALLMEEKEDSANLNMFLPEFLAYKHGRNNRADGVGTGWYERFRITHISDIHSCNDELKEALLVSNGRVNAVVDTGDNGNGTTASNASTVKKELSDASSVVKMNSLLPMIQVAGNHDVTGLTKKEFFDIVCATVQQKAENVVWGDAENYRFYGYIDFTDTSYNGNFRIIMLDPFDYGDGNFGTTYPFQCAVFSQKQIDWLIAALLDAASQGLNVITAMHYSFGDAPSFAAETAFPDAIYCQDAFMIPDIVDAIQKKTSISKSYHDSKGGNDIRIERNFSTAGELKFVAHLFGHIHSKNHYQCQKSDGSKKYDMLMLGEAALATYGNALNKVYREEGTVNGIAFSALEIDVVEQAVYRVAYGAYLNYDKSNSERTMKIPYRFNV